MILDESEYDCTHRELKKRPIAVFAYSFAHKKTNDFLMYLKSFGFESINVIAAPKVKLKNKPGNALFSSVKLTSTAIDCEKLCQRLGYSYIETKHSDVETISNFITDNDCAELAIISGARIISKAVINLFKQGVVNFHPGAIPQTSGLDSFYWMMKNKAKLGTTVHFIDARVDAGELIFFQQCDVEPFDTLQTIEIKQYDCQLIALKRLMLLLLSVPLLAKLPIHRPTKNKEMNDDDKELVLSTFDSWRDNVIVQQKSTSAVFQACLTGDLQGLKDNVNADNVNEYNHLGWCPLIVAAFNQHKDCVQFLIDNNADVNATNEKGTSVLMYAKTNLIEQLKPDLEILRILIASGADRFHKDGHGKDIFFYINKSKKPSFINKMEQL